VPVALERPVTLTPPRAGSLARLLVPLLHQPRIWPGADTRGPGLRLGGYLAGPGSVVGGRRYEIARDDPIAELPGWLAALITRPASARLRRVTRPLTLSRRRCTAPPCGGCQTWRVHVSC